MNYIRNNKDSVINNIDLCRGFDFKLLRRKPDFFYDINDRPVGLTLNKEKLASKITKYFMHLVVSSFVQQNNWFKLDNKGSVFKFIKYNKEKFVELHDAGKIDYANLILTGTTLYVPVFSYLTNKYGDEFTKGFVILDDKLKTEYIKNFQNFLEYDKPSSVCSVVNFQKVVCNEYYYIDRVGINKLLRHYVRSLSKCLINGYDVHIKGLFFCGKITKTQEDRNKRNSSMLFKSLKFKYQRKHRSDKKRLNIDQEYYYYASDNLTSNIIDTETIFCKNYNSVKKKKKKYIYRYAISNDDKNNYSKIVSNYKISKHNIYAIFDENKKEYVIWHKD